jgi:hypothetical protein
LSQRIEGKKEGRKSNDMKERGKKKTWKGRETNKEGEEEEN